MRTDEPRVPHVAGPENAGVEGLNVEDSRVLPHREAAVVDGRRTDSTGEGDRMPPSPSATVRATPPVWPEVWYVWWSRAGTEARMAPRTVELVPKYSKPHEPTRPAATHADLREDARATHNTIPRIKESRRYPHPRRNPMVRRSRPRQRVDETTHAPRNVRYLLPRPAIGGHSRVHGTTHQVAVCARALLVSL